MQSPVRVLVFQFDVLATRLWSEVYGTELHTRSLFLSALLRERSYPSHLGTVTP